MNIHEYQALELFREVGIPARGGKVVTDLDQAVAYAKEDSFPLVIKAQVLTGGRGKAGGVKLIDSVDELEEKFPKVLGLDIKGHIVEKILIGEAIDIKKEVYLGIAIDGANNDIVCLASPMGGVDIEEVAKNTPDKIFKFYLKGERTLDKDKFALFLKEAFGDAKLIEAATNVFERLLFLFLEKDCSLAEINPFVLTEKDEWIAADAKINFDDNALYRHPEVVALKDKKAENPQEAFAKTCGLSFVKLDGNVGCIVNGAGLAMATMDVIKLAGGQPANFLDVGGSSNPEKILHALKIILEDKNVKAILINIFGGITRCDDIANGILTSYKQMDIPVPLIVRLTGTNEKEALTLLKEQEMTTYSSMREAVEEVVSLIGA